MHQNDKTKQINEAMTQITNVIERARKKGALSEYCQIHNTNTKKRILNEHNLQTNTTACKYLNNSRHRNFLLGKQSPQIVGMCDAFIWTIFNLSDPNCTIDSRLRINFLVIPKFLTFDP